MFDQPPFSLAYKRCRIKIIQSQQRDIVMKHLHISFKCTLLAGSLALLTACHSIIYQPTKTIEQIEPEKGYRLEQIYKMKFTNLSNEKYNESL